VIYRTAWVYANAKAGFIGWTMGVNHSTKGTETVNAINNLALITGNIGRAGAAPFSITGQCNAMGTRESGFASGLPGYRKFESEKDRSDLATLWGISADRIPTARGLAYPDIIEAALDRRIRALWIIATNPIVSFPNLGALRQALGGLEFLVVQDGYEPTPTSEYADLMLPAAIWGEKEGTYTNSERRVSKVNRAVNPPGEARPDFDIFLDLAAALGARRSCFRLDRRSRFDEWKRVSAARLCDYSGISYEAIEEHGGIQWPCRRATEHPTRPALHATAASDRHRQGRAHPDDVGAVSRAADARISAGPQHRADRRALAHADEDGGRAHPRAPVAQRLGRDEPARRRACA
jgi:assimilatory nitrate reductase catalytic subunit